MYDTFSMASHMASALDLHTPHLSLLALPPPIIHQLISNGLQQEIAKGHLIGPLDPQIYPYIHVSSLGAVPKKHSLNKWHLILDLSYPKGHSINDGIDRKLCSLTYMKVDDVVQQVLSLGKGTLLAKKILN